MLPSLFSNSNLPVLDQVVQFTQARHGVLAGNIANLNTPGYKTRDLSPEAFERSLKQALEASRPTTPPSDGVVLGDLSREQLGLLGPDEKQATSDRLDAEALAGVKESMKSLLYHDDSDVSLESQITEISKNQAQHNLAITLMNAQFRLMRSAISETVV